MATLSGLNDYTALQQYLELHMDENIPLHHHIVGFLLTNNYNFDQAIEELLVYRKAQTTVRTNRDLMFKANNIFFLAFSYRKTKQYDLALKELPRMEKLTQTPKHIGTLSNFVVARSYYEAAIAALQLGNIDKAQEYFNHAIVLDPNNQHYIVIYRSLVQ